VTDLSLSAPGGTNDVSSARLRLATEEGAAEDTLGAIREIAADKDLSVIEPLVGAAEA
jgi:ACT domain-containing protein